jgi:heme A synthase
VIRRLAAVAASLTVVLIVAGGVVTNTDSGLACPDWPTCYGSLVPRMTGNVAVEHTHRLIATAVGLLTVAIVILALRKAAVWMAGFSVLLLGSAIWAARVKHVTGDLPAAGVVLVALGFAGCAWVAWRWRELSCVALILVMFQGLLGGLTVLYRLPTLVLVMHLGTSMLFMCVLIVIALGSRLPAPGSRLVWVTTAAIYLQILLGATVRHTGAGLVCTDLPYCRGAWWPTNVHPMVHLHMAHRAFAFVVAALVIWSSLKIRGPQRIVGPALVLIQIALGVLTILTFKDLLPLTAHLLVGALLLADYVSLLVVSRPAPSGQLVQALA